MKKLTMFAIDSKHLHKILFSLLLAGCFFLVPTAIFGCSCAVSSDGADKYFEESKNVFVLRVNEVQSSKKEMTDYLARTSVEKVYKGDLKPGTEIRFGYESNIMTSCDWMFGESDVGKTFLFYRGQVDPGKKTVGLQCHREGPVSRYAGDIVYLDKISTHKGRSRVSGIVSFQGFGESELKPMSNFELELKGNGISMKLITDMNGVYEKYDLPPGEYSLSAPPVTGYSSGLEKVGGRKVVVAKATHTEEDFWYSIVNEVSGRVVDRSGNAMPSVCLKLESTVEESSEIVRNPEDCTDLSGRFSFNTLYEKSYRLVINPDNKVSSESPFEVFYYPSTRNVEDATIFNLGSGIEIKDLLVTPPEMAEIVVLSGRVIYEDGKPATGSIVRVFSEKDGEVSEYSDQTIYADKAGEFRLRLLKGKRVQILAQSFQKVPKNSDCKKLKQLVGEVALTVVKTQPISIDAATDVHGVELRFPFPKCEEKNDK